VSGIYAPSLTHTNTVHAVFVILSHQKTMYRHLDVESANAMMQLVEFKGLNVARQWYEENVPKQGYEENAQDPSESPGHQYLNLLCMISPGEFRGWDDCPYEAVLPLIRSILRVRLMQAIQLEQRYRTPGVANELYADFRDVYIFGFSHELENLRTFYTGNSDAQKALLKDIDYLVFVFNKLSLEFREHLNYEASIASLKLARLSAQQSESVNRITLLAFIFIPLSFVTSIWGMNIDVLGGKGAKWWTVLVGVVVIYAIIAVPLFTIWYPSWQKRTKETLEEHFAEVGKYTDRDR
jgi:hypothetical protein